MLVASSLDLLGTKLKVIMQRAESKDYADIAQLLRAGPSLIQGLGAARSLYGSAFAPAECLRALTFFDDGDLSTACRVIQAPVRSVCGGQRAHVAPSGVLGVFQAYPPRVHCQPRRLAPRR